MADSDETADDERHRTIAACTSCGALYAALEVSDGSYLPIGRRDGCQCGGTAFDPVEGALLDSATEPGNADDD
ncbi:hypothetical protein [Halopiger djelfimassiliensis]|uniref:hypothetical protein n=1 Tax=Halopiger djelfimassiliensis TaxID=1293047 RepID=UPI000677BFF3|nr:hypothetical protein [Halopiger djelfimassiliensis]